MRIIEKLESKYNIKIERIATSLGVFHLTSLGTFNSKNKDLNLEIINSHKFVFIRKNNINYHHLIKCEICGIEADILEDEMHCFFYDQDIRCCEYVSCSQVIMEKACI